MAKYTVLAHLNFTVIADDPNEAADKIRGALELLSLDQNTVMVEAIDYE